MLAAFSFLLGSSDEDDEMAMKVEQAEERVAEAKAEEEARYEAEENRKFEQERKEEEQKDKGFAVMKKELEENMADPWAPITRKFFDEEMLAINERVHHLSERLELISERIHSHAGRFEHLPT
ncbi:MAG: hypothetical protein CL569_03180 [Alphaproteobacteria bacterium]|nr:hypothetical protein [Alphaproteobacteria bacterium]|tara:strand:- start:512 stop:880 length:369 start_codon:yes stop_codon:yes gene_type:complete